MERRWAGRTYVNINVDVVYQGMESQGFKTRDISLGGVFVEMPQAQPPQDALVELAFHLGQGADRTRHKINAKVVRQSQEGLGLMFRDFDASTFRSLQEVLRQRGMSPP